MAVTFEMENREAMDQVSTISATQMCAEEAQNSRLAATGNRENVKCGNNMLQKKLKKMPGIIRSIIDGKVTESINPEKRAVHTDDKVHKYSHIYRRKTRWEMLRLSFTVMGIEIAYAALTAFVTPIILQIGVDPEKMTLVWAISPIMGILFSPIIGSLSDRCTFFYGRRRPFIILLSILEVTGLILISNGKFIGSGLGKIFDTPHNSSTFNAISYLEQDTSDKTYSIHLWIIGVTILGVVISDFSSDALQNPSRAYLLDVCNTDDHARGLSTCAVLAGCGGFIGHILGSIDWNSTVLGCLMGGHIRSVYTIITVLFIVFVTTSITAFKEMPLGLVKRSDVESSKTLNYPSIKDYLKSIVIMPNSMKILVFTNLLCWLSHVNFALYFTHFVGQAIFHGDPLASEGSDKYLLYEEGIRFACIGMSIYSIFCGVYSMIIERLMKLFGLRILYIGVITLDSISLLCMATFKSKMVVLLLCSISGIMYCTILTIPYILVAHYHTRNVYEVDRNGKPKVCNHVRGLGTDISIIGTSMCIAQFLLSIFTGKLVAWLGSTSSILTVSSFFGFCATIAASQILYLDL